MKSLLELLESIQTIASDHTACHSRYHDDQPNLTDGFTFVRVEFQHDLSQKRGHSIEHSGVDAWNDYFASENELS